MKRLNLPTLSFALVMIYLFLPVAATALYSLATEWNSTVLPEGLTVKWFAELYSDSRFLQAFARSFLLSGLTTIAGILIMVPAIFSIVVYAPKLERLVQLLVMLTYALPGVILAVGLIRTYAGLGIPMILIAAGAYLVGLLPFLYQGIRNSLHTVQAHSLMEAAELLGAGRWRAFLRVIVPNIMPGILVSALLSFSILFGEFVLINILVGGRYETLQIYLYNKLSKSGHIASAITVTYFILMAVITGLIVKFTRGGSAQKEVS
ncbi:ABC transporter permease subunit [Brevibacillus ruminantium]|uniref:ABC transporter permease subunit n=1 Tax=Brevibacillus ruminantium TaxID=2950604 RepID=A0ABY4WHW8_9BACL|nr:ABC transporter permease subunit [Brevibacillus ruminantium]USG64226.1 ABC transporter permease subunit [Brevibacillus ruminantium]